MEMIAGSIGWVRSGEKEASFGAVAALRGKMGSDKVSAGQKNRLIDSEM